MARAADRRLARVCVGLLAMASVWATPLTTAASTPLPAGVSPDCRSDANPVARANELIANRYLFPPEPLVTLPADLTWKENPFGDDRWQFQLHSMRYVLDLIEASEITADPKYEARGLVLLQDWFDDNPRASPPSQWSWSDHTTALRAVVYACAAELTGMTPWLEAALVRHGNALADPSFYVGIGNHALDQAIGLLEVGNVLGRGDWLQLAAARINALIVASVDTEGVTNEQSVGYQLYNFDRYGRARDRLVAVGLTPGGAFARIDLMPDFLAAGTRPDGRYELIGDTQSMWAPIIPGTVAEYMATQGASGPQPSALINKFSAGYLFARSGWGDQRAWTDETFWSMKWGPGPILHGHADGLSMTLYSYGSPLLVDTGLYAYGAGAWRSFFKSHRAHNVVTVDGLTWSNSTSTSLISYAKTSSFVDIRLRATGYPGVTQARRVTYSRGLDFFLVEDRMRSTTRHTYRQLWHFVNGAKLAISGSSVWSQRSHGNVLVRQLAGTPEISIIKGATSPIQGWISYTYGTKVAAPVEQAILRGTNVRYLTLIVPGAGIAKATVSRLSLTSTGYAVTVAIRGHAERVIVDGSSVSIRRLY